jgi:oligopeptide/dipeptide ABC transporter ATP-binding protein
MAVILDVENLKTYFKTYRGLVKAVDGVSYQVDEGEIVGVVGESGCGKSVSMLSIMGLVQTPPGKIVDGKIMLDGQDLLKYKARGDEMASIRGSKIAMIFQEPMTSLNPVLTIGRQITESLESHLALDKEEAKDKARVLLTSVGIPDAEQRLNAYPHQFSGGMRQRVMIAIALSCRPKILIADEPTTAVDVTTQAQLLELMSEQIKQYNTAMVIVTHNLGVVARYVKKIYIMYAGRVVESGPSKAIFGKPWHPYTIGLLKSVPRLGETRSQRKLVPIPGLPPDLIDMPPTCAFLPRCSYKIKECFREAWPELRKVEEGHYVSCLVDTRSLDDNNAR